MIKSVFLSAPSTDIHLWKNTISALCYCLVLHFRVHRKRTQWNPRRKHTSATKIYNFVFKIYLQTILNPPSAPPFPPSSSLNSFYTDLVAPCRPKSELIFFTVITLPSAYSLPPLLLSVQDSCSLLHVCKNNCSKMYWISAQLPFLPQEGRIVGTVSWQQSEDSLWPSG